MMTIGNITINLTSIVSWVIFGLVVGFVVHLIDPRAVKGGVFGTILTGILGALVGGFLANLIYGLNISGFSIQSLIIAVIGALVLAFIERLLVKNVGRIRTKATRLRE